MKYNKNDSNNSSSTAGVGFTGLLAIAFIILKLVGVIDWRWLWVLSPLWIPVALYILYTIFMIILVSLPSNKNKRS